MNLFSMRKYLSWDFLEGILTCLSENLIYIYTNQQNYKLHEILSYFMFTNSRLIITYPSSLPNSVI